MHTDYDRNYPMENKNNTNENNNNNITEFNLMPNIIPTIQRYGSSFGNIAIKCD